MADAAAAGPPQKIGAAAAAAAAASAAPVTADPAPLAGGVGDRAGAPLLGGAGGGGAGQRHHCLPPPHGAARAGSDGEGPAAAAAAAALLLPDPERGSPQSHFPPCSPAVDLGPSPIPTADLRSLGVEELLLRVQALTSANAELASRARRSEVENERLRRVNDHLQREHDRLKAMVEPKAIRTLPSDVFAHVFGWLNMKGLRHCLCTCRSWRRAIIKSKTIGPRLRQKILVIGGSDGTKRHDNVEQFDMFTSRWTTLLGPKQEYVPASQYAARPRGELVMQLRQAKGAMASVQMGESIYVFGGFNNLPLKDSEVFNLRTRSWRDLPSMRSERSKAAIAPHGGGIYVMGGYNGSAPLRSVERFDPATEEWHAVPGMLEQRGAPAAVELGGSLYVMGGWKGNIMNGPHSALASAERFDPRDGTWHSIAPMKYARSTPSAVVLYSHIYVLGGYNGNDPPSQGTAADQRLKSVERYDPQANVWEEVAAMHCGRSGDAAVAVDGKIFTIGGWDGQEHFNLVEVYSPATDRWTITSSLLLKRRDPAAVTYIAPPYNDDAASDDGCK